ncbi:MAG: hypothetical protein NTW28_34275, partial [Candidatus Solibacter sp.]|nr:hypothetical protein [Candidatus Solibacter sp.]
MHGITRRRFSFLGVSVAGVLLGFVPAGAQSPCPAGYTLYVYRGSPYTTFSDPNGLMGQILPITGYACVRPVKSVPNPPDSSPNADYFSFSNGYTTITQKNAETCALFGQPTVKFICNADGTLQKVAVNVCSHPNRPQSSQPLVEIWSYSDSLGYDVTNITYDTGCPVSGHISCSGMARNHSPGVWTGNPDCASVLFGSVTAQATGAEIWATFRPNGGSLALAASLCGVDHFNWQQTINYLPAPNTWRRLGPAPEPYITAPPKVSDPPPPGLVDPTPFTLNCKGRPFSVNAYVQNGSFPFYYTADELRTVTTNTRVFFHDGPGDPCMSGNDPNGDPGAHMEFTTKVVGVDAGGNAVDLPYTSFDWMTTWTGSSGGVWYHKNLLPPDPGSGSGGTAVLSVNGVPTRGPCATDVTALVAIKRGGYVYNMSTGHFLQSVTLTNTSAGTISGPISVVPDNLSAGASL